MPGMGVQPLELNYLIRKNKKSLLLKRRPWQRLRLTCYLWCLPAGATNSITVKNATFTWARNDPPTLHG